MRDKIFKLISEENKKKPYTDEVIAEILHTNREDITVLRQQLGIADSRERRRSIMMPVVKNIMEREGLISDRRLTQLLNEEGFEISRFIAHALKEELGETIHIQGDSKQRLEVDPNTYFKNLIGYDGSMNHQIAQAQAAMLYPPKGLHTLIHGPSGAGKSQLAECMYFFAKSAGIIKKDKPFIIFNCADYADNAELLMSQLFGYVSGAFTGAMDDKVGLVEKANGGILFLDEVHRLPSEGQEMLFYLIDHGMYRKLGDSETTRKSELLIIAATTEDLNSYLLTAFRRRIPMVIDLPPLSERPVSERPVSERYLIIKSFFYEEALRLKRHIMVDREAVKLLLSYTCPGNIGQLKSDIQVSCAKSFLKYITSKQKQLRITKEDIPIHVLNLANFIQMKHIHRYCDSDLMISNIKYKVNKTVEPDFYQMMEERYEELKKHPYDEKKIIEILGVELDNEMDTYLENMKYQNYDMKRLEEIVGSRIIQTVRTSLNIIANDIAQLSPNIIYPLCLHISASYERLKCGKKIMNPQLDKIRNGYPQEFAAATKIAIQIEQDLHVILLEDEIAFIAMYLKTFAKEKEERKGRIGIIVMTHGNVGIEMVKVANQLLNVNYAIGLKCDLDEAVNDALEKVQKAVEHVDEGKGCLLLTDMGSLVTFGQIITQRINIDVRTISRVDTVMVIEAIRRALLEETTLGELERALNAEKQINFHGNNEMTVKEPIIVSACLTGKGSAVLIQSEIQKLMNHMEANVRIVTIGVASEHGIQFELDQLSRSYQIIAIIGNFQITYQNIPFISTTDILNNKAVHKLSLLVQDCLSIQTHNPILKLMDIDLISCKNEDIYCKNDILEKLVNMLVEYQNVSEEYRLDVYKREAMGGTIMKSVAIPHGFTEHVTKPAIAIMILKEPIVWEDNFETTIILMPALMEENLEYTNALFQLCSNAALLSQIASCEDAEEIIQIIHKHTKPST